MMAKRIDKLTAEQTAQLDGIRDEWLAHGLAATSANRELAVAGVNAAYRAAGLEPPHIVVWLDSPIAGAYGAAYLKTLLQKMVGGQVRDQVWDQVWGQVWDQVGGQVGGQVWDQVGGQVWGQVWDQVGGQVRDQLSQMLYGQHEAGWLSFYDTFRRFGLECCERLNGLMQVAQNAGWWWPFRGAVILTERPTELHRDNQGRLHCETGPAIRYPDGWGVHAWHGTRVPADLITRKWTLQEIFAERNSEIRRCAIERIGWDVFIQESGLQKVASAPDPGNAPHHIALYDLPDELDDMFDARARILLCVNGTVEPDGERRRFGLPVPAHHNDPIAAAADLYGWPVEAYRRLEVRR